VHHGRLFILLYLLLRTDEIAVAIDLFEHQEENLDRSGDGSRAQLLGNLSRRVGDTTRVRFIADNSLRVDASQIRELAGGPIRLFSIDGGHTAEITYHDLRTAYDSTRPDALVIIDDYFNPGWPAVSEGVCRFMATQPELVPLAIIANKFIFARGTDFLEAYRRAILGMGLATSESIAFGMPVIIANDSTLRLRLVRSGLWRHIRTHWMGRILRRLV
jgi:hypothetical protein